MILLLMRYGGAAIVLLHFLLPKKMVGETIGSVSLESGG
jgi:hypothetical protein